MIYEVPDFSRYSPEALAAARPEIERVACLVRRTLNEIERVLGRRVHDADHADEFERLRTELLEARARCEAAEHDLASARAWIEHLQDNLAVYQDAEVDKVYQSVGLAASADLVVIEAARRALLARLHPDRARPSDKGRATAQFAAASAAFDRIMELRRQ